MNATTCNEPIATVSADVLVVGYFKDSMPGYAAELSAATGEFVGNLMNNGDFDAKANEVIVIPFPQGLTADRLVLVGLGEQKDYNRRVAFRAAGTAAKAVADRKRERVVYFMPDRYAADVVAGAMVGCNGQDLYRQEKKIHPFDQLLIAGANETQIREGTVIGNAINTARELVNQPANHLYPQTLAERAEKIATRAGFEIEIWDESRLVAENCRTLLAVAQGSQQPPRLLRMNYRQGGDSPEIALIGKGVTFDSGGYSLKPSESMLDMKCDMGGAATVIAVMQAVAEFNLPVNVSGYCGLVENMVSGSAFKLGDVIQSRNGKTIEIHNTDAEGRLVLADVLDVASKDGVDRMIDFATLTGACLVALGTDCAGLFSNDQDWCDQLRQAAEETGEDAWQMPMSPDFAEQLQSNVADLKNMGNGRWGGAITAAKFLEEFVEGKPWIHVDIAGPAWLDSPRKWMDAGGTGCFVRSTVELIRRLAS